MRYTKHHDYDNFSQNIGIEIIGIEEGVGKTRLKIKDEFYNPMNSVHGGIIYTLADVTTGYVANSYGLIAPTLHGSLNFLSPALRPTKELFGYSREVKKGKTIAIYDVEIFDEKERKIASGTFTFYIMKIPHKEAYENYTKTKKI